MKVFISWSGGRSKALAVALREWLPLVLHYVEPWLSDADIEAGDRWASSIAQELSASSFGIVCVTPENMNSPWVLFEAGALTKSLETSKVIPLLLDLEFSDISGPLSQFQAKKLGHDGIAEVIHSLQASCEHSIPEDRATKLFDGLWGQFEEKLESLPAKPSEHRQTRTQHEVLEELVASVRNIENRQREQESLFASLEVREPRRRRMRRMSPMIFEMSHNLRTAPSDPFPLLIFASALRDDVPWLYDLTSQLCDSYQRRRRDYPRILERYARSIDIVGHMGVIERSEGDMEALDMLQHETMRLLDRVVRPEPPLELPEDSDSE